MSVTSYWLLQLDTLQLCLLHAQNNSIAVQAVCVAW